MLVLTGGHRYLLDNFEGSSENNQILQFIHKGKYEEAIQYGPIDARFPDPDHLYLIANGTTNEEVLRVLIDRIKFLNEKLSSEENFAVIDNLQRALFWLEKRTADRAARGVEGTDAK